MLLAVFKIALALFAVLLIAAGLLLSVSPAPFGFVLALIGFFLLAAVAPSFIRWIRRRWRWFDRQMHKIEKRLPKWLAKPLRDTNYDREEEADEDEAEARGRGRN